MRRVLAAVAFVTAVAAGCGSSDANTEVAFASDVNAAIAAVEAERGPGQEFFEVTATAQLTNVFVATNEGTAAVPYVYRNGELEPAAPTLDGAEGFTFAAAAVDFDADAVLSQIADELPDASIDSLSVEGGEGGSVRYVVSVRSDVGGVLDVTVSPDGTVLAVDPI